MRRTDNNITHYCSSFIWPFCLLGDYKLVTLVFPQNYFIFVPFIFPDECLCSYTPKIQIYFSFYLSEFYKILNNDCFNVFSIFHNYKMSSGRFVYFYFVEKKNTVKSLIFVCVGISNLINTFILYNYLMPVSITFNAMVIFKFTPITNHVDLNKCFRLFIVRLKCRKSLYLHTTFYTKNNNNDTLYQHRNIKIT